MPKIEIDLTDFQIASLAHRYASVTDFATNLVAGKADQYGIDLSNKLVQRALDAKSVGPKTMDRQVIVQAMFDEDGYMNAADCEAARKTAQEAAEHPIPNFNDRVV